jgi:hypothetical protein
VSTGCARIESLDLLCKSDRIENCVICQFSIGMDDVKERPYPNMRAAFVLAKAQQRGAYKMNEHWDDVQRMYRRQRRARDDKIRQRKAAEALNEHNQDRSPGQRRKRQKNSKRPHHDGDNDKSDDEGGQGKEDDGGDDDPRSLRRRRRTQTASVLRPEAASVLITDPEDTIDLQGDPDTSPEWEPPNDPEAESDAYSDTDEDPPEDYEDEGVLGSQSSELL